MRSLFSNLNTRLIVVNLVAFWLFFYAFQTLAFLHDYNFLCLPAEHMMRLNFPARVAADRNIVMQAGNFGLLAAYVISWFIAQKNEWHWLNGVISFVITFILCYLGWFGWNYLHVVFLAPQKIFEQESWWGYLSSGLVMIALGLLVLFSKRVIRYIDRYNSKNNPAGNGKLKPQRTR